MTGLEDKLDYLLFAELDIVPHQAAIDGLPADGLHIEAAAVVRQTDQDIAPFPCKAEEKLPLGRLAGGAALVGAFETVVDGVADHMLQGGQDTFHHRAVDLSLHIAQPEADILVQFAGHLAHDAAQAGHQAGERHHAGAHQALLEIGVDAGLVQQQ